MTIRISAVVLLLLFSGELVYGSGPYDGQIFRGTIAYSCDGNWNDPDDWAASPVSLGILAALGLQEKLVHFHYNSILWSSVPEWEREHAQRVLAAAEKFGFDRQRFFDCQHQLNEAVVHLADCINAASAESPLYLVLAGPVDVVRKALERVEPAKRGFVYCISHSRWNEGYARDVPFTATKRELIDLGIRWVQIADQNVLLSASPYRRVSLVRHRSQSPWVPATEEEFRPYFWLRDAQDVRISFLWESLVASGRPDPSDAGMTYFLVSGDVSATPEKLRELLLTGRIPQRILERPLVRLEAENFSVLEGFQVASMNDRSVSHRLCVAPVEGSSRGLLRTLFDEPYTAEEGTYDLLLRYFLDEKGLCRFRVTVGGNAPVDWALAAHSPTWLSHIVRSLRITRGDTIAIEVEGNLPRIDYVECQLEGRMPTESPASSGQIFAQAPLQKVSSGAEVKREESPSVGHPRFAVTGPLDDPRALPGQIIVAGDRPGYLKINGGRAVFLCGPDNPEEFLYLGTLRPDGTRDGPQMEMIEFLGKSGVNAFHFQMFRMRRCNIKDEGDDTHCPFVDHDPSKPLNEKVLDQWDFWLGELEKRGIIVHLEFYNDATDVELMGWTLDSQGNLHPDEQRFIDGIVKRFCHRKNIIWGIEESSNKLPRARVRHFLKIAERIRQVDPYNHPIVQSFVTPETAEKDIHPDGVTSADYRESPYIDIATWLHIPPHGKDFDAQHAAYLRYALIDRDRFITMRNETEYHPIDRRVARIHNWACALAGMHALEAQLNVARADRRDRILDAGKVVDFMEQTDWYLMKPADHLASGSTKWVLAQPGKSYIAYTYDYTGPMGLKELPQGQYELLWFDSVTGKSYRTRTRQPATGEARWEKPEEFGREIALYVRQLDSPPAGN